MSHGESCCRYFLSPTRWIMYTMFSRSGLKIYEGIHLFLATILLALMKGTSFVKHFFIDTTLLFFQVDLVVGHNHLFKRSIILVKAWCYYESRILGAHHVLISTYALETLVLYIFHVFYNCFSGPLEVCCEPIHLACWS